MNRESLTQSVGDARWILCEDNVWRNLNPAPSPAQSIGSAGGGGSSGGGGHSRIRNKARDLYPADGRCGYCFRTMTRRFATIDHIVPKSRGGQNVLSNLVWCCYSCNTRKGNATVEELGWQRPTAIKETP